MDDEKAVFHICLDLNGKSLPFKVGDSIGIYGQNDPYLVDTWLKYLRAAGSEEVFSKTTKAPSSLREYLSAHANLSRLNAGLARLLGFEKFDASQEPLDLLRQFSDHIDVQAMCENLSPLLPRFYSIASSSHHQPGTVDLTVALLRYTRQNEVRFGVASYFLCQLARERETPIPIYLQPTPHFTLPNNHDLPIIMIGPGTGVAPFRGFMQERVTKNARGKNWLFFGERREERHFYYADFWKELIKTGHLQLTTAFSRDQPKKLYVHHRVEEHAQTLWRWIQDNASIYVCGDAKNMGKSVETSFLSIFQSQGNMSEESARSFLQELRNQKRYLTDVY